MNDERTLSRGLAKKWYNDQAARRKSSLGFDELEMLLHDYRNTLHSIGDIAGVSGGAVSNTARRYFPNMGGRRRRVLRTLDAYRVAARRASNVPPDTPLNLVIRAAERAGLKVERTSHVEHPRMWHLRRLRIGGAVCAVHYALRPIVTNRGYAPYFQFQLTMRSLDGCSAVILVARHRIFVIPTDVLRNLYRGTRARLYATRAWKQYENAWHLLQA